MSNANSVDTFNQAYLDKTKCFANQMKSIWHQTDQFDWVGYLENMLMILPKFELTWFLNWSWIKIKLLLKVPNNSKVKMPAYNYIQSWMLDESINRFSAVGSDIKDWSAGGMCKSAERCTRLGISWADSSSNREGPAGLVVCVGTRGLVDCGSFVFVLIFCPFCPFNPSPFFHIWWPLPRGSKVINGRNAENANYKNNYLKIYR